MKMMAGDWVCRHPYGNAINSTRIIGYLRILKYPAQHTNSTLPLMNHLAVDGNKYLHVISVIAQPQINFAKGHFAKLFEILRVPFTLPDRNMTFAYGPGCSPQMHS